MHNLELVLPRGFAMTTNFCWFYRLLSKELGLRVSRQRTARSALRLTQAKSIN